MLSKLGLTCVMRGLNCVEWLAGKVIALEEDGEDSHKGGVVVNSRNVFDESKDVLCTSTVLVLPISTRNSISSTV